MMSGIMIALMASVGTPMDIGIGGVFYMQKVDTLSYNFYGAEAEFLAHLMMDQLYLRTGILYFIRDEDGNNNIGLGTGVGSFGAGSVDALYYFTKQKPNKYKMSPYVFGGFYFAKSGNTNAYGLKAGAGLSYPLGKKSPTRLFGEAGALFEAYSAPDPIGSDSYITLSARGGIRFNVLN